MARNSRLPLASLFVACFLGLIGIWSQVQHSRADEDQGNADAAEFVKLAKDALAAHQAAYEAQTGPTVEDLYNWSRRLMLAELDAGVGRKAVSSHVLRVDAMHKRIAALHQAGRKGGEAEKFTATAYFLAKAKQEFGRFPAPVEKE